MSLEDVINERVSFLKEQINPKNKPVENKTFQLQIEAIRSADIEKVAFLILQKKTQLANCKDVHRADSLFAELDALEWLQRQVVMHLA
jgi:hypothetical protein